jgi:hypothetical protein
MEARPTMVSHYGAIFSPVASGTVVVCENNTRVLGRSGFSWEEKTCCTFDCTPNVDTAIEDKIKDRQKATLQATRIIHACKKESLFFLQTNWTMS